MSALELKIPPVALMLLTIGLMVLGAWSLPSLTIVFPGQRLVAVGLGLVGVIVTLQGLSSFRRAKTTVNPMTPDAASSLVVVGIYRWTRNPMYLGFLLALCGSACFLSNAIAAALLPVFVLYMTRFQIRPEERALEARFGTDFIAYKGRVRRWI